MKVTVIRIIAAILSVVLLSGIVFHLSFAHKADNKEVAESDMTWEKDDTQAFIYYETADQAVENPSNAEITEDLKARIAVQRELNDYLREEQASMNRIASSDEEIKRIIQSKILKSYEENVLIAVEIKALAMESLGAKVPEGFSGNDDEFDDYSDYLKDDILNSVKDTCATGTARDILENGITGAMDGYGTGGGLSSALDGAASSVTEGVASAVENKAVEFAENTLDEVSGGVFGVAKGIADSGSPEAYLESVADNATGGMITGWKNILSYDKTPGTLLQGLSNRLSSSSRRIKELLNKETMTSKDISDLLYEYAGFGNSMDNLSEYGAGVNYEWHGNYEKMLKLYRHFLSNETIIKMLESEIKK